MATREEYLAVRNVIQYILVPIIFVIGFLGNAVSILVLTRKRMRCSTNIYLTGLAVADIVYLAMLLIMSAQHYKVTEQIGIFWRCRGLFQWLIDGSSYISLYIVVCFTIERYIAVCYPMKGQVFCTVERAKKVLAVVVVIILLSILSANFEFELVEYKCYVNKTNGEKCDISKLNQTEILLLQSSSTSMSSSLSSLKNHTLNHSNDTSTIIKLNIPDDLCYYESSTEPSLSLPLSSKSSSSPSASPSSSSSEYENVFEENVDDDGNHKKILNGTAAATTLATTIKKAFIDDNSGCHYITKYRTKESALASNTTYRKIFDLFTIIVYSALPLILIIIFNTFLIRAVQKSNLIRKKMTNMSVRQIKNQQQENKITIILIAVVILFIICQTPWAIYLFLENFYSNFMDDYSKRICGNIFNTLVAIDAASNFILYCLLSDKYRKTLKELLMGYKYKRQDTLISRQGTLSSSWYSSSYKSLKKKNSENMSNSQSQDERKSIKSQKPNSTSKLSSAVVTTSKNNHGDHSDMGGNGGNDNGTVVTNTPTSKNNNVSNKTEVNLSFRNKLPGNNHKQNLQLRPTVSFRNHPSPSIPSNTTSSSYTSPVTRTDLKSFPFNERNAASATTTPEVENQNSKIHHWNTDGRLRQNSITSELAFGNNNTIDGNSNNANNHTNIMMNLLKSSDSSGSLTRSQSLIIQPKTKHSPDCPNFDSNF